MISKSPSERQNPMKPGRSRLRTLGLPLIAGVLSLALSACAGSVAGGTSGGLAGGGGGGYASGADQATIDAALADLPEVELTFQPSAASAASIQAPSGNVLAAAIEERSGGKIKVDTVWGQAIAGYSELFDALSDGRVDLALALPVYQPAEFPATNAVGEALGGLPSSPYTGEMITNAVGVDVAWNTPQVLQEYEDQSVYPIAPFIASGGYYSVCTKTGVSESDYPGRQVRIASKAQSGLMSRIGASPVSMEYTEAFEAMQRGTVDCSLAQLVTAAEGGLFEVAPNIGYMTDTSISRSASSLVAGKKFAELPLGYRQIIFDVYADHFHGQLQTGIGGNAAAVTAAKKAGGKIERFDDALQKDVAAFNSENRKKIAESGIAGDDLAERVEAAARKWTAKAKELGYSDKGTTADFDEWYDPKSDYRPMGEAVYQDVILPHRPS